MALTLHLVRHGETDWNREGRIQGSTDIPLNALGRQQAHAAAARLAETAVGAVLSSDLSRARDTAEIIAAPHAMAVRLEPELRERNFGVLEGRLNSEAAAEYGVDWRRLLNELDERVPGAESTRQHYARVAACLDRIAAHPPADEIVVVCHGGTVRRALGWARGGYEEERWQPIDNASVHTVTVMPG